MTQRIERSRRRFLKAAGMGLSSFAFRGRRSAACSPALERINIGVIGLGSRGFNLIDALVVEPTCQITAVCDVDRFHYRDRVWGSGRAFGRDAAADHIHRMYATIREGGGDLRPRGYSDYRKMLAEGDLDGVVVATPDHWHAMCTLDALRAGMDVYCEKPVTHLFGEGLRGVDEVRKQNAVFQTGSQQRSDPLFQKVVRLTRSGVMGQIKSVEVGLP